MPRPGDTPELDYLDYTSIRFPSDRLTLGVVRKVEPEQFDVEGMPKWDPERNSPWKTLNAIMETERILAKNAYEQAMGRESLQVVQDFGRADLIDILTDWYLQYGLAPGAVAVVELIKDIEAQAVAQAQSYRKGPPPGRS